MSLINYVSKYIGYTFHFEISQVFQILCSNVHSKKMFFFSKPPTHIMGVVNFNGGTKYEKTTNFNLKQFYFIKNDKALLNDTEYQNKKRNYKLIQEFICHKAVKC